MDQSIDLSCYKVPKLIRKQLFRGEDPNAKFLAMVAQKQANSTEGWWRRVFRKGGKTHGERLTDGEVKKGLEHDVRGV